MKKLADIILFILLIIGIPSLFGLIVISYEEQDKKNAKEEQIENNKRWKITVITTHSNVPVKSYIASKQHVDKGTCYFTEEDTKMNVTITGPVIIEEIQPKTK